MRRLILTICTVCAALMIGTGAFAQVPADPNNPNETVPDKVTFLPYGETINLASAKKAAQAGGRRSHQAQLERRILYQCRLSVGRPCLFHEGR